MHLKKQLPFMTSWTDFSKGRFSPAVGGMLEHAVNPKSSGLWHKGWGRMTALGPEGTWWLIGSGSWDPQPQELCGPWLALQGSAEASRAFWGPQQCLQAQCLGSRASSGSGCN